jgi:LPXTG-site transpeptidase (sortase) family protein
MEGNQGTEKTSPREGTPKTGKRVGTLLIFLGVFVFVAAGGYYVYSPGSSPDLAQFEPEPTQSLLEATSTGSTPTPIATPSASSPAAPLEVEETPQATAQRRRVSYPVRVAIPRVDVDAKIVEVNLDADGLIWAPMHQAGHYAPSAKPGEGDNIVIVGHVYRGLVFNHLPHAKVGDEVLLHDVEGNTFNYKVDEIVLLPIEGASTEQLESNLEYVLPTADERLTLITCWPETSFTHRLIVIARPYEAPEDRHMSPG